MIKLTNIFLIAATKFFKSRAAVDSFISSKESLWDVKISCDDFEALNNVLFYRQKLCGIIFLPLVNTNSI